MFSAPLCLPEGIQCAVVADASFRFAIGLEVSHFICPRQGDFGQQRLCVASLLVVSEQQKSVKSWATPVLP